MIHRDRFWSQNDKIEFGLNSYFSCKQSQFIAFSVWNKSKMPPKECISHLDQVSFLYRKINYWKWERMYFFVFCVVCQSSSEIFARQKSVEGYTSQPQKIPGDPPFIKRPNPSKSFLPIVCERWIAGDFFRVEMCHPVFHISFSDNLISPRLPFVCWKIIENVSEWQYFWKWINVRLPHSHLKFWLWSQNAVFR